MKLHHCAQGSTDWHRLRAGKPTASEFSRILTPKGKRSAQADGYMMRLLAELMTGAAILGPETKWMERGHDLEGFAVKSFEFETGMDTEQIGFVTNDSETIGASPDRLVGSDGLLEIKCPAPQTHVGYLLTNHVEEDYFPQLQGQLYICEREWTDIVSYHPEMPAAVIRVERDEEYIAKLAEALNEFVEQMAERRALLESKYGEFRKPFEGSAPMVDGLNLTEADIEGILAGRAR